MFQKARIRLTAWYLVIILLISIFFSGLIYYGVSRELDRGFRRYEQRFRFRNEQPFPAPRLPFSIDELESAKKQVLIHLISTNIIIALLSALASYFLAGKTLKPIEEMVNEQNRFITDASHELRTPLTSLKTSIEVNLRDKNLTLDASKKVLQSNLEEINSMQSLSDNLLSLAQYQKSNGNLIFEIVPIKEIIDEAVKKVLPLAKKKQITIAENVNDYSILGDKKSLVDLFVILLDNAIKYSPKKKSIEIKVFKGDRVIIITVKDFGMGIEEKDLLHIFDRFYRADSSRSKSSVSGFGLGLSIAKKIVEVHKGTITAESTPGKQTTFTIKLPTNH